MPTNSRATPIHRLLETGAPGAVLWIRVAVGIVFVSEGIQKFLYPAALGAGRFAKIGIPAPDLMGPFIGVIEIVCGALVLVGLLTRLAAILLLADMTVALLSTKVPILIGHGYWRFAAASGGKTGVWAMLHEARKRPRLKLVVTVHDLRRAHLSRPPRCAAASIPDTSATERLSGPL